MNLYSTYHQRLVRSTLSKLYILPQRLLPMRKPSTYIMKNNQVHWQFNGGYIGLFGTSVDNIGNLGCEKVPEHYKQQRVKRDGDHSHITLMIKSEMKVAAENMAKNKDLASTVQKLKDENKNLRDFDLLLRLAADIIVDDIKDLGIGKTTKQGNEAYFKVLNWQSANQFRQAVGLAAKDFHVTVGFKDGDIHDVPKNESTLI